MTKLMTYVLLLFGWIIALGGVAFVFMYFWEAIIVRMGDPDQSLIFWYLPILFIGIIAVIGGISMLIEGIHRLKNDTEF